MRVLYAMGKGLVAYGVSVLYLAHLLAARNAAEAARAALDEPRP